MAIIEKKGLFLSGPINDTATYYDRERTKHDESRSLSTSTAMITVPDRNRRHRIASALPWRSCRAAGGLRRPSDIQTLLVFLARATCCRCAGLGKRPLVFDLESVTMRRRTEDPKGMYTIVRRNPRKEYICTSASNWRRRIPSTLFCDRKLSLL